MRTIVLGTRKSNLAMKQTEWVINELNQRDLPFQFDTKKIVTKGDQIVDVTLSKVGGKGLFIKEIEDALSNEEIDIAVHSMKDLPGDVEEGFTLGAMTNRVDPRDVLISNNDIQLDDLPAGAVIGTSSLRRSSQILARRPDVEIQWIRGNIDTRLRKLREENFDAIVLAAAGLGRMGWDEKIITEYLDPDICLPAVGQGALGLECRAGDKEVLRVLEELNDELIAKRVTAERAFLQEVEGGCQVPIGGFALLESNGDTTLTAMIGSPDGETILREKRTGPDPREVGRQAAQALLERGGKEILDKVKSELDQ